ncbi:FtsX-like permease family protein [Alteromonadaceae bacterium M269]|nr:FtsX-like permease family protein [Alteromonadaceae bacterium M269]
MWYKLAWRLFRHEARRGELTIILLAITLSVAAVLSLSLFSERLQSALTERSADFIAADRVLDSRKPVDPTWLENAEENGLNTAHQVYARSMAFANEQMSLVSLRAATPEFPLKGDIKTTDQPFGVGVVTEDTPKSGEAWVESRLFQSLGLELNSTIDVGDMTFTVTRVLSEVPDSGFNVFGGDPKVLISIDDLDATNITGPGSRVTYSYFFTGESNQLDDYYDWLEPNLDRELHRWESVEDDDSAIGRSVARAEQFFLLASLLAIVLAAVSIAVAAQRYSQRHYDPVAIMKTLGASKGTIQKVYLLQIIFIATLGILLGTAAGMLIQQVIVSIVAERMDITLDGWHWRPLIIAVFTGVICALMFSLYPMLKLFSVPPLRVLRRQMGAGLSSRLIQFVAAGGAILLLMWAYSNNIVISLILFISGIVLVASLMLVTYGLIWVGRKLGQGKMGAWQLAWARIQRRSMDNSVQLISFAITIMLLLIVLVMRNDMVQQWRDQLPEGTPNYFMANITETQLPELQTHFSDRDVQVDNYFPVIRARFVAINDEKIRTDVTKEEEENVEREGRDGLGREANLTWSTTLGEGNTVIEGTWLSDEEKTGEFYGVSVESGIAENLNIGLGDLLTFNIGSEIVNVEVTSVREVNWQSMRPNFFFVLHPKSLEGFSPTYITSFHLDKDRKTEITGLMQPFASVTLFDVDARLDQLRSIIDQVSVAVEFILVLVLVAGALVLIAQVQASMDERQQELAILRTLGAKGTMIRASVVFEFIIIGVVAGAMAAVANELALFLLQSQVFEMQAAIHWEFWLLAPAIGAGVVGILGAISCWRLLSLNTSHLLRQMV